jgi:hypothetical protein
MGKPLGKYPLEVPEGDGRMLCVVILRRDFVRIYQDRVQYWPLLLATLIIG